MTAPAIEATLGVRFIVAFGQTEAHGHVTQTRLRAHVRELLAPHKAPVNWVFVDELPMTASGKIQKVALLEQWHAAERRPTA